MARPLRIELAGGLYHITSRGDRREDIYFDDTDRLAWLEILGKVCQRFNWRCHAWCQMTNHYHVLIETIEGNLSQGMRQLNGVYTQAINRRYKRVGHVFQGRYKAILVEKDSYLIELARYVVLNPVRAKMVVNSIEWPWSSYHAMIGTAPSPSWLETDWILGQFSLQRDIAITKYMDFVQEGLGQSSVWEQLRGQIFLGSDVFIQQMQQLSSTEALIKEIPSAQRRPLAQPLQFYQNTYSNIKEAMVKAYASGDYTMQQIAHHFGVHYSTVSRAIKIYEYEMLDCKTCP